MHPSKFLNREAPQEPTISDSEKAERLDALGTAIAAKRKEAVDARSTSGIESVWMYCEEAYLGIDDANRSEFSAAKWAKPTSMQGPVTSNVNRSEDNRSTAFVRLTSRYVDGASAKVAEIILPIDDKAFSIKATPVPEAILEDKTPVAQAMQQAGRPMPGPQMGMPQGQPGMPPQAVTGTVGDLAKHIADKANDAAKKAETRIYDWMVECNYPAEARKVIKDAARIGTGVLKGPYPDMSTSKAVVKTDGETTLKMVQKIVPDLKWTDPWNLFPADGCGENIHDGDYILERDFLSSKNLRRLKGQDGYLDDQIDKVLEEGPGKAYLDAANSSTKQGATNRYEVWYFYGEISKEELSITNAVGKDDVSDEKKTVSVIITLVNDSPIRAVINPNENGEFPYRVMGWSRRPGHWAGVGVGEQISMPQRMVNASTRGLLNNAGLSSGPQIIIDQLGIVPADNSWKLTPNKIWYKTGESTAASVRDAFIAVTIPSVQAEMMGIIMYAMKLAEESSGIPLVTQGQTGPTTPQTFGQAELQDTNSHTWLRSIGYAYDDSITEPIVKDLYEWLLLDPEVPDDEKGDFTIDAKGSIAMVERAIQETTMMQLLGASANPAFELDPAKLMQEYLRSKRMDPRSVRLSDEDIAARKQQPPQPPPQIAAAQIRADADMKKTQMVLGAKAQESQQDAQLETQLTQMGIQSDQQIAAIENQTAQTRIKVDTDRDTQFVLSQERRDGTAYQGKMEELKIKREIAMLDYSSRHQITLEQAKVQLAATAMTEQTKREIASAQIALSQAESHSDRVADVHKHHASISADQSVLEPVGRAENGKAFSQ